MPRTILIVDDSESGLATLELSLFPLAGTNIRGVSNARDALALLDDAQFSADILITDLDLPRMDGFELVEQVRARPHLANLKIVVISGNCDPGTPGRLRKLGVDIHIVKPYSPAQVREKLEPFLDVRK